MFNSKQQPQKAKKPLAPSRDTAVTILTSGCHFNGKLYCRGASRIGGRIEGQVVSEGLLIIEEEAVITADIKADEAIIQGRVQGKLVATGRVELCASSHFEGDVVTPILIVREGAQFNGHSTMAPPAEAQQPTSKTPRIVSANGKAVKADHKDKGPDISADMKTDDKRLPEVNVRSS